MKEKNKEYIRRVSNAIQTMFVFVSPDVADFIACQSALETAYGNSTIYLENHNCFGMRFPHTRLTTAFKESRDHSFYCDVYDSIYDYFFWCLYNGLYQYHFKTLDAFKFNFPFSKYCPNPMYLAQINSIYQSFKSL